MNRDRAALVGVVVFALGIVIGLVGRFRSWSFGYDVLLAAVVIGSIVGMLPEWRKPKQPAK